MLMSGTCSDAARGIVTDGQNLSVGEYLDRWMNDTVRGTIRESTCSRDKYLLTNHIIRNPGEHLPKSMPLVFPTPYSRRA